MFERYTEKARRVIFFARYEASQFGSPYIETEHILLGLLREDKALTNRILRAPASVEAIRKQIEGHTTIHEKVSTSVDLPLSNEGKRVLAYAAEEAERLSHKHIGTEHLLLGMLREERCFAAEILNERGIRLSAMREELAHAQGQTASYTSERASTMLEQFSSDLTRAAVETELDPLVGRADELQAVLHALGSRNRNSVVLIGEAGVGKTAIVEGLALWIAAGNAPPFVADKCIFALDLGRMAAGANPAQFATRINALIKELIESHNPILFVRELTTLVGLGMAGALDAVNILRPALSRGQIQCITEATAADYEATLQKIPWFASCSRTVRVSPLSEEHILKVLQEQKARFENYHSVSYTDEALQCAARYARGYPARAVDVVDSAGTIVKLRQAHPPEEIHEVQKRIRFILHRMESAIANHEFEKARFYSDEERKERANLEALREKYRLDEPSTSTVVRLTDMEAAISRAAA